SMHLYLFRLHGVTTAWWESKAELMEQQEPFWPGQVWKDAVCAFVFLALLVAWCMYHPAPLEGIADPSKPYEARPEWYFMFLFQLLKYFHGPYELVGTTVWAIKSDTRMTNPVEAMAPAGQPAAPLQKLNAAKLYATSCLPCHGADGTGNQLRIAMPTIPNFTDTAWQKTQTDEQFRKQIHDGKENAMPAFKDKLSADQIQVLTQFVRVFDNKPPAVR